MSRPSLDISALPRFAELSPSDVVPTLQQLITEHRKRLGDVLHDSGSTDFARIVEPLEAMDQELARIFSPVNHLQAVLGSPDWRKAYDAALPIVTEYSTELAQNAELQQAYARVEKTLGGEASPSRRSVVEHALRDFHLAGVDLPTHQKQRYREIMQSLASAQAQFEHNVQDSADAWSLHFDDVAALSGLPVEAIARAESEAQKRGQGGWLLTLDHPTYEAVETHANDRNLRETLYRAWVTRGSDQATETRWDNAANINAILALRHEAANLVGFANFADYSLATKMADSTTEVLEFLRNLATHTRAAAEAEFAELRALAGTDIRPWDTAYWLEKLKQQKHSIANEQLRQYFPVDIVVRGMFELAGTLYGLSFQANDNVETWHDEVRFVEVRGEDGTLIGGFYRDLFARTGKRAGAWVDDCISRMRLNGSLTLPVGHLVCNFPPPNAAGEATLTHSDVVTLFHEFGHMLHHLLTRIDFPSISGINGVPWDAVELPSQFMENFAWTHEVLKQCSAHVVSGESLPKELFERLEESRHTGAALSMLRQLEFALFDFRLHAEYDDRSDFDVMQVLREVREEISLLEHPDYNRFAHGFSHIFAGGYGAGYYSYKWAEVLAADAFAAFKESGVFNRDIAGRFRREILEVGGSRDFMQAYIAFRGRRPSVDALLKQCGIAH